MRTTSPPNAGSSPLTRGKLVAAIIFNYDTGLIPAHAGKTSSGACRTRPPGAHPRSRGENLKAHDGHTHVAGSSPLTRGKPARTGLRNRPRGLIPAHAGKTEGPERMTSPRRAHPRSRGENPNTGVRKRFVTGSSPLTRGKLGLNLTLTRGLRLIPAHAGKTNRSPWRLVYFGAHPRSRGENFRPSRRSGRRTGSSPLTRGKPGGAVDLEGVEGLIPAHAGKTQDHGNQHHAGRAHPRSRGEN